MNSTAELKKIRGSETLLVAEAFNLNVINESLWQQVNQKTHDI